MNAPAKAGIAAAAAAAILAGAWAAWRPGAHAAAAPARGYAVAEAERALAAPGLVEAASGEVAVRPEIAARLTRIAVEEGDRVARGQLLAALDDAAARAAVAAAQSTVDERQADLSRVLKGANQYQRREAWQELKQAEAEVGRARAQLEKRRRLFEAGVLAREEMEAAERDLDVAQERWQGAYLHREMAGASATGEDRGKAEASLAVARAQLDAARSLLAKTVIRSPLDGVVLRRYLRSGEIASPVSEPVVTVVAAGRLRVRAEVDETDVAKVRVGQQAYVTAEAFGERRFPGRVIRIAGVLGRKNIRTDQPSERVDTKVLETLVELDAGAALPLGLRVTVFLLRDGG